jgi:hypothetical protein
MVQGVTEPERFFFVHLQKTAGTTLFRRLRHHFGPEAVYPTPEQQRDPESILDVDYLRAAFEREGDRLRVITGHFPLCTTELLGVPFTTMTVLRDPLDRTLSFLRHQKRLDPSLADVPMDQVYGRPQLLHGLIHNHMVKMLGLTTDLMTHGAATLVEFDDAFLARAEANLAGVDVVGLQGSFDEFCAELVARFGWDLGRPERGNATDDLVEEPSERFVARVLRDNALDIRLYAFAEQLVRDRRAQDVGGPTV